MPQHCVSYGVWVLPGAIPSNVVSFCSDRSRVLLRPTANIEGGRAPKDLHLLG